MLRQLTCIFAIALALLMTAGFCFAERVIRAADQREITLGEMIREISGSRVILIGEDHDSMLDHWRQIKVMKALNDSAVSFTIGLEMFTSRGQKDLDNWVAGMVPEEEFVRRYYDNWSEPWYMYRDIFIFAQRHVIPMIGLNLLREVTRKVATEGFAALNGEERKMIPGTVTCEVDPSYMALVKRAFAGHGMSDKTFVHFCEAQMLWNRAMAWNILAYLRRHPDRTLVVLAGKGHAMRPAIPREVLKERAVDIRVVLPEDEVFTHWNLSVADTDYLFKK